MNRLMQWVMAAALICSSTVFTGCSKSGSDDVQEPVVKPDPVVNPDPDDNGANSSGDEVELAQSSTLALVTASHLGWLVGSDGKAYDPTKGNMPIGVTAVAKICYVGGDNGEAAPYNHGLALALSDEGSKNWSDATGASGAAAHTPAAPTPITSSWMLPSKDQWNKMIDACKNVLGTQNNYLDLRDGFSGIAGASNLQPGLNGTYPYWSSTEEGSTAWVYHFDNGWWGRHEKTFLRLVRACLAF